MDRKHCFPSLLAFACLNNAVFKAPIINQNSFVEASNFDLNMFVILCSLICFRYSLISKMSASAVECYNCHEMGHIARSCPTAENNDSDATRTDKVC